MHIENGGFFSAASNSTHTRTHNMGDAFIWILWVRLSKRNTKCILKMVLFSVKNCLKRKKTKWLMMSHDIPQPDQANPTWNADGKLCLFPTETNKTNKRADNFMWILIRAKTTWEECCKCSIFIVLCWITQKLLKKRETKDCFPHRFGFPISHNGVNSTDQSNRESRVRNGWFAHIH